MSKKIIQDKIDDTFYNEYYGMIDIFDNLYQRSQSNEIFDNLIDIIFSKENVLLAYKNLKKCKISLIKDDNGFSIKDIEKLSIDDIINKINFILFKSEHGYRPKNVNVKYIEKFDGDKKLFGIPGIWDRLIQQCILQVLDPICEAKFSDNSYGYRPDRTIEQSLAKIYRLINFSHLNYVIQININDFFDNVNHSKLIKQIWNFGIHDKKIIYIIRQLLKSQMNHNKKYYNSNKGIVQTGILSSLFCNIVLNEFDEWIENQWQKNPIIFKYAILCDKKSGMPNYGCGYKGMRNLTKLKEMNIVRYGDNILVFCKYKNDADKLFIAIKDWFANRLKLSLDKEKSRVINLRHKFCQFLGFDIGTRIQGKKNNGADKYIVYSKISKNVFDKKFEELKKQAKNIARPRKNHTCFDEIKLYNSMVLKIHNYFKYATHVCLDLDKMNWPVTIIFKNRLGINSRGSRLSKSGRILTSLEKERFGKSKQLRYEKSTREPIYVIGFIKHKHPIAHTYKATPYSEEGRLKLNNNYKKSSQYYNLLYALMKEPLKNRSIDYINNKISLFINQEGKCAITSNEFQTIDEIHCHHIIPKSIKLNDDIDNLILIIKPIHQLIHSKNIDFINKLIKDLKLTKDHIHKINQLRIKLKLFVI